MKPRLVTGFSCVTFLVSAVSEYGLNLDFPLTPPVWLLIAFCSMAMAIACLGYRNHCNHAHETVTRMTNAPATVRLAPLQSPRANSIASPSSATGPARRFERLNPPVTDEMLPASTAIFPIAARGPPLAGSHFQSFLSLSRPALLASVFPIPTKGPRP